MDDQTRTLVARAQARDQQAIEALFERYRDRLRHALRKLIGPRYRNLIADSEDATHDAILSALGRLVDFEYRGEGSFLAWLLKGAEYQVMHRIRQLEAIKRGRGEGQQLEDVGAEPVADETTPSQAFTAQELADRVRRCLRLMPDREREIIMLRRYMQLDMPEVSEEMGLPTPGAARALLSRAQARLSGLLSRQDTEG